LRYWVNTRPNLAFAVVYVSRFPEEAWEDHLAAVKQVLIGTIASVHKDAHGCVCEWLHLLP
jgi:hypothetical protein